MCPIPQWSHALSVRNADLDEQHIVLIELSKDLLALLRRGPASDAPILDALKEFADYARRHDALEEQVLATNQCPTLAAHRAIHRATEAQLDGWMAAAAAESLDRRSLAAALDTWMSHHLTETDMPVQPYLHHTAVTPGGAAASPQTSGTHGPPPAR